MKNLIMTAWAALALTACSSAPVYHDMTQQQKEIYAQNLAGEYMGRYRIVYPAADGKEYDEVEVTEAQMTFTDWSMHTVVFHDFPLSLLARVVQDTTLAQALGALPNRDFSATYSFYDYQTYGNGNVNLSYDPVAIPLTVEYGGSNHHLMLKMSNGRMYYALEKANLDVGKPFKNQRLFQFYFTGLYEGDTLLWAFNDFYGTREFYTYFEMDGE